MTLHSHRQSLRGLGVFFRPYRLQIALAAVFLLLAAGATLAFPWAMRRLIDDGLMAQANSAALATVFLELWAVAVGLAGCSAARYDMVS